MGRLLLVVAVVAAVVFTVFPGLDLWMSAQFFRPEDGFYLKEAWWAVALYEAVPIIAIVVSLACIALLVQNRVRGRPVGRASNRFLLFVLAALAVGPGLVVNVGFKDHWGRARPRDVTEFFGDKRFTPALQPTDQCDRRSSRSPPHGCPQHGERDDAPDPAEVLWSPAQLRHPGRAQADGCGMHRAVVASLGVLV